MNSEGNSRSSSGSSNNSVLALKDTRRQNHSSRRQTAHCLRITLAGAPSPSLMFNGKHTMS